jgi:hypothetical protein
VCHSQKGPEWKKDTDDIKESGVKDSVQFLKGAKNNQPVRMSPNPRSPDRDPNQSRPTSRRDVLAAAAGAGAASLAGCFGIIGGTTDGELPESNTLAGWSDVTVSEESARLFKLTGTWSG